MAATEPNQIQPQPSFGSEVPDDRLELPAENGAPGDAPSLLESETRPFDTTHPSGDAAPRNDGIEAGVAPGANLGELRAKASATGQRTTEKYDRGEVAKAELQRQQQSG